MEKIMRKIFSEQLGEFTYKFIGLKLVIALDEERRIEVAIVANGYNKYNALRINLVSKRIGAIEKTYVEFVDIFEEFMGVSKNGVRLGKVIEKTDGKYTWSGLPTEEDLCAIADVLQDYIKIWK